jgi:hypothetical protein
VRIQVVGGGEPSDEELAAITIALEAIAAEAKAQATEARGLPGWVTASLREAVGGELNVAPPAPATRS